MTHRPCGAGGFVAAVVGVATTFGFRHCLGWANSVRYIVVGVAAGVAYRHAQATLGGRGNPGRNLSIALAWTPLVAAVERSIDDDGARQAFALGCLVGIGWYRPDRGDEG